jgi:tetratricopeptide (TPR) repeat protein
MNVVRVQSSPVSRKRDRKRFGEAKQRRRITTGLILVCIVVGGFFLGRSTLSPLFGSIFKQQQPAGQNAATPVVDSTTAAKQTELETQAKGFLAVLQRQPEDRTALTELVNTRVELARIGAGSLRDTIEPLEKLAQLNPEDNRYSILLAQTKQHTGDLEGAATVYRSMLEAKPGNMEAMEGLVTLLMAQKRPEAAIGLLQDTLDTAPKLNKIQPKTVDETSVKLLLASVYADQQRYKEAIAIYDDTIKTNKDDFRPLWGKAAVLQLQDKTDEAKSLFNAATELAPAKYKDQIKARIKQLEAETPPPDNSAKESSPDDGESASP